MDKNAEIKRKTEAAKRLIVTCEKSLLNDEYNLRTIRGVSNLSYSDVETVITYCEYFITNKTLCGIMPPVGNVKEVLSKINL
jgi:hypothetical protein